MWLRRFVPLYKHLVPQPSPSGRNVCFESSCLTLEVIWFAHYEHSDMCVVHKCPPIAVSAPEEAVGALALMEVRQGSPRHKIDQVWALRCHKCCVLISWIPVSPNTEACKHRPAQGSQNSPWLYYYHKTRPALSFSLIFIQPLFKNPRVRNITGSLHYLCKSSCIHRNGAPSEHLS